MQNIVVLLLVYGVLRGLWTSAHPEMVKLAADTDPTSTTSTWPPGVQQHVWMHAPIVVGDLMALITRLDVAWWLLGPIVVRAFAGSKMRRKIGFIMSLECIAAALRVEVILSIVWRS